MMIFARVCTTIMIVFLPETCADHFIEKKTNKLRKEDPVGSKDLLDWPIREHSMVCSSVEHHNPQGGISLIFMSLVRSSWQRINIATNLYSPFKFFPTPELPRRYISVSLTDVSNLISIIVLLHYQRILLFGRVLPQRFPSSRFNYSLMWVALVYFSSSTPIYWLCWSCNSWV